MKKRLFFALSAFLILGLTFGMSYLNRASATIPGTNSLVSYDSTNTSPVGGYQAAISDDGNFIAYQSSNANIISGDTNSKEDVFLRNLHTSTNSLVDQSTNGTQAAMGVYSPYGYGRIQLSRNGRYTLFTSADTHIIDGQTLSNSYTHLYLRDTLLGTTTLVDTTTTGVLGNEDASPGGVSDDGRYVVFLSKAGNLGGGSVGLYHVYMKDMSANTLQVISRSIGGANANNSAGPAFSSCDGAFVVFSSPATNLTPSSNGYTSTYLVDLRNGFNITNLTLSANNTAFPYSISCNGGYIVIASTATNLTTDTVNGTALHLFRYDRTSGQYTLVDKSSIGTVSSGTTQTSGIAGRQVSDVGTVLFTSTDTSLVTPAALSTRDVYLRTPENNTTELVAISPSGQEGTPAPSQYAPYSMSISADGKNVVYLSAATNLIPGVTTVGSGGGGWPNNVVLSKVQ